MPGQLSDRMAIATVVTSGMLDEFRLLRYSFDLFHGPGYHWFIRCDQAVHSQLSTLPNTHCRLAIDPKKERTSNEDPEFRSVVAHKMGVVHDAWTGGDWKAVTFLDADLLATSAFLEDVSLIEGDVVLSPHYYNAAFKEQQDVVGYFNSGFLLTRTPEFHKWWYRAFVSQPNKWTDQKCVEDAPSHFNAGIVGRSGNIGFWRREAPRSFRFDPIPHDCMFFHAHLLQPSQTQAEFVGAAYIAELFARRGDGACKAPFTEEQLFYKAFGVHILEYLQKSGRPHHRTLYESILSIDRLGLYAEMLKELQAA